MNKKGIKLQVILDLYNQGMSAVQIGEQVNCSHSNVTRRLKKAGIEFKRDYSKGRYRRTGRYHVNENFFEDINNEEKAYFLGLMYSDGSVSNHGFYIKMKDEDVIQKFKTALNAEQPIHRIYWGGNDAYIMQIYSKKLTQDLIKWGCYINKTKTIRFPSIASSLQRHFIRGFFDGDGCLQLQDKIYHCRFDLTSASKMFLEDVRPIITSIAKTNGGLNKERKYDVWHLSYSGYQVQQILDWLYKDTNLYLKRKYFKYQLLSSR